MSESKSPLKDKSFSFAIKVVALSKLMIDEKEYVISKQILRSGTAIGALTREAQQAESRADFIHKLAIALKESNETEYWLDLILASNLPGNEMVPELIKDNKELLRLLISIIKTSKNNKVNA